MFKFKKFFSNSYKSIIYKIFKLIYGEITSVYENKKSNVVNFEKITLSKNEYKLFFCNESRLYTDTIHDLAIIKDNSIINGPSYQYRSDKIGLPYNEHCSLQSQLARISFYRAALGFNLSFSLCISWYR